MSSVELLSDRSSVADISFRSMTEEQRQNALQPPLMGGRAGAGSVPVVPALNIPRSGPLLRGQDPAVVAEFITSSSSTTCMHHNALSST